MDTELTIQQVSRKTKLSIDTLRYYERIGLIDPIRRAANRHRRYRQKDLEWIELIIRLRDTGMPLAQIRHFANLRRIGPQTTKERRMILEDHRHILAEQMKQLMQHLDALADEIDCYWEREGIFTDTSPDSDKA